MNNNKRNQNKENRNQFEIIYQENLNVNWICFNCINEKKKQQNRREDKTPHFNCIRDEYMQIPIYFIFIRDS